MAHLGVKVYWVIEGHGRVTRKKGTLLEVSLTAGYQMYLHKEIDHGCKKGEDERKKRLVNRCQTTDLK